MNKHRPAALALAACAAGLTVAACSAGTGKLPADPPIVIMRLAPGGFVVADAL